MGKYIYKITNTLNGKAYIGQSNNPKRRFTEHKKSKDLNISLIGRALAKYGEECFTFEIIGFFEDYNQKEKDFIKQFNTLYPNGYNLQEGGEEPPIMVGEENPNAVITREKANQVIEAMLDFSLSEREILKRFNITRDIFRHIREGDSWRRKDLDYPLRPSEKELNERKAQRVKEMLKETDLSQKEVARKVGFKRSYVTMINIGKHYFDEKETYPIRDTYKKRSFLIKKLLIETDLSQTEIAKMVGANIGSVNAISLGKVWRDSNLKYPLR